MQVNIKRLKNDIKVERKIKLSKLNNEETTFSTSFSYSTSYGVGESAKDLHLFCLSLTNDILNNVKIEGNKDKIDYDQISEEFSEEKIIELNESIIKIFNIVYNK